MIYEPQDDPFLRLEQSHNENISKKLFHDEKSHVDED